MDEKEGLLDDGVTTKTFTIDEAAGLLFAMEDGKKPAGGFYLGGTKYNITQFQKAFEDNDHTYPCLFAQATKKGVVIAQSTTQIIAGFYDETKSQTAPNCKKAVVAFTNYMIESGY